MNSPIRYVFFAFLILLGSFSSKAQLPNCGTNIIYLQTGSIYNWDPSLPFSATNPVLNTIPAPTGGFSGFAVSPNLNSSTGPSPTFYTTINGNYYYYNGSAWVNTGHSTGNTAAVNIGAGGGFIYNLVGGAGQVYKYDGTGNGTLLVTINDFQGGGPYDLAVDCSGNFYILRIQTPGYLRKYSPTGTLLQSWTISGAPSQSAGGGFGIVNGNIYYYNSALYGGTLSGTNIAFTNIPNPPSAMTGAGDWGNCPMDCAQTVYASIDTAYYCGTGPGIKVKAQGGTGPYIWTRITGDATMTGPATGDSIVVVATQTSKIALNTANPSQGSDTVMIIVPTATLDAGPDVKIDGCGTYSGSLHAKLKDTLTWIPYSYTWSSVGTIASGITSLNPVVTPSEPTEYYITVSVPASKGGCVWTDSVKAIPVDRRDDPQLIVMDTVLCVGQATLFTAKNKVLDVTRTVWDFGDNSDTSQSKELTHTFNTAGTFTVKLTSSYSLCPDSVLTRSILVNPLPVVRILNRDTVIKYGQSVVLKVTGASKYFWSPVGSLSDANVSLMVASPKEPTLYTVIGLDHNDCRSSDSVRVSIDYRDPLLLPSAFSPNGDNLNDVFHIPNLGFRKLIEFRVFNRWGKEVFYTNDADKGWDGNYNGTPQELGVYNYIIRVAYPDGYVETNKGDVTLFR